MNIGERPPVALPRPVDPVSAKTASPDAFKQMLLARTTATDGAASDAKGPAQATAVQGQPVTGLGRVAAPLTSLDVTSDAPAELGSDAAVVSAQQSSAAHPTSGAPASPKLATRSPDVARGASKGTSRSVATATKTRPVPSSAPDAGPDVANIGPQLVVPPLPLVQPNIGSGAQTWPQGPDSAAPGPVAASGKGPSAAPQGEGFDAFAVTGAIPNSPGMIVSKRMTRQPDDLPILGSAAPQSPSPEPKKVEPVVQPASSVPNVIPVDLPGLASSQPTGVTVDRHLDLARGDAWLSDLAGDIAATATDGGHLKFALAPASLGRLDVEVRQGDAGITIHMAAHSQAARDILESAQSQIVGEVRAQGVRVTGAEVSTSASPFGGDQSHSNSSPRPRQSSLTDGSLAALGPVPVSNPIAVDGRYA